MQNLSNQKLLNSNLFFTIITSLFLLFSLFYSTFSYATPHLNQISITQIVDHPGLNAAYQGIIKALQDKGFNENSNLKINHFSAQGQSVLNMQIANKIMADKKNKLAIGISTQSIQALINARKDSSLPLVFSSITNPAIINLSKNSNIIGALDSPPLEKIWPIIKQISDKINKIGVIYNASEMNSVTLIKQLQDNEYKFEIITKTINSTNQLKQATQAIIAQVDMLLIIPDNTVVAGIEMLLQTVKQLNPKLLTLVMDSTLLEKGALISVGYSQFDVGYIAGSQAAAILKGKDIRSMDISAPKKIEILINKSLMEFMDFKIPLSIQKKAKLIEVIR